MSVRIEEVAPAKKEKSVYLIEFPAPGIRRAITGPSLPCNSPSRIRIHSLSGFT
jgi:hypothetical protein